MLEIRDYFKTSEATTDYIIADLTLNKISNKEIYFYKCVNERIEKLNNEYNGRVEKILNFIILHCDYSNLPLQTISKIIYSLSKVTNAVTKGILSIIKE
jgi:hypothetical protein